MKLHRNKITTFFVTLGFSIGVFVIAPALSFAQGATCSLHVVDFSASPSQVIAASDQVTINLQLQQTQASCPYDYTINFKYVSGGGFGMGIADFSWSGQGADTRTFTKTVSFGAFENPTPSSVRYSMTAKNSKVLGDTASATTNAVTLASSSAPPPPDSSGSGSGSGAGTGSGSGNITPPPFDPAPIDLPPIATPTGPGPGDNIQPTNPPPPPNVAANGPGTLAGNCDPGYHPNSGLCIPDSPFLSSDGVAGSTSAGELISKILKIALTLAGVVALLFVVIGSFLYLSSGGNAEQAKKGRTTITAALIGLILIILSYVIVTILTNLLTTGKI